MKVAIIGGGNMGLVLGKAFLSKRLLIPSELTIVESDLSRHPQIKKELDNCLLEPIPDASLKRSAAIFLAVKPQDAPKACTALSPILESCAEAGPLVVSIMAGVTLERLKQLLGGYNVIVRSMPNLAARVNRAMTAYYPDPLVTEEQKKLTHTFFSATGECLLLPREDLIDAVTAVSGSGPAYFFYFVEHLLLAAQQLGFSGPEAKLLVEQTITGALELWQKSGATPEELRQQVTSKGGTTAAALSMFEQYQLGSALQKGVLAACERAKELSK